MDFPDVTVKTDSDDKLHIPPFVYWGAAGLAGWWIWTRIQAAQTADQTQNHATAQKAASQAKTMRIKPPHPIRQPRAPHQVKIVPANTGGQHTKG